MPGHSESSLLIFLCPIRFFEHRLPEIASVELEFDEGLETSSPASCISLLLAFGKEDIQLRDCLDWVIAEVERPDMLEVVRETVELAKVGEIIAGQ